MTKGNIRPTQKTIAEMTGLAVTTVSRALQGDPEDRRGNPEGSGPRGF